MNSKASLSWHMRENHPPVETLFLSLEGELPAAESARVDAHLKLCWECQAQAENWREATNTFIQFRRQVQPTLIPGPPSNWSGFRTALRRSAREAEHATPPGRRTIGRFLRELTRPVRATLASAATALAALIAIGYLAPIPPVSATELLSRAVSQEKSTSVKLRTRVESASVPERRLRVLFASARLDWEQPLSARAFQQWHDGLPHKTDRIRAQASTWTLETTTPDGPLLVAALTVRAGDFHPTRGKFEFAGREEVEISETGYEPVTAAPPPPEMPRTEARIPILPGAKLTPPHAAAAAPPSSLDVWNGGAAEMDARVALFNAGADLGGQIRILSQPKSVVVEGIVETAAERDRIVAELRGVRGVEPRIQLAAEAVASTLSPTSPVTITAGAVHRPLLEDALDKQFPNRDERSAFVRQTMESSRGILMHAWALRRLAERYTPEQAGALDQESRAKLREIAANHADAISSGLDRTYRNLSLWIGASSEAAGGDAGGSWQGSVDEIFNHVRRIDAAIGALLSKTGSDRTQEALLDDMRRAYPALQRNLFQLKTQLEKQ